MGEPPKRKDKVIVCSIPKSGTHIIEYMMRLLGYLSRYSAQKLNETNTNIFEAKSIFNNQAPFWNDRSKLNYSNRLSLLKDGMVLIGHEPFPLNNYITTEKIILAKRNFKQQFFSFYKHEILGWTHNPPIYDWEKIPFSVEGLLTYMNSETFLTHFKYFQEHLLPWFKTYPDNVVRFEDLTSSNEQDQITACSTISRILNIPLEETTQALKQTIGVKTKTFSGKVNGGFDEMWTDEVDKMFYSLGLDKLNRALGYE